MKDITCSLLVVVPVFNDWDSLALLIPQLDDALAGCGRDVTVLVVNDGSVVPVPEKLLEGAGLRCLKLQMLDLRRNLGNQRALAVSLPWVSDHVETKAVVVMDGDGEDNPADVPKLLAVFDAQNRPCMVFGERTRRSASWTFKLFYALFRVVHKMLTGQFYKVGNFSVLSPLVVDHLVLTSELWNHYAIAAIKTRLPFLTLPSPRTPRYAGNSKMNFSSLAVHGLTALSTYGEIVGIRLMMASLGLIGVTLLAILVLVVGASIGGASPLPAWTLYLAGFLTIALLQMVVPVVMSLFIMLTGRQAAPFIPIRDYGYFVSGLHKAPGEKP